MSIVRFLYNKIRVDTNNVYLHHDISKSIIVCISSNNYYDPVIKLPIDKNNHNYYFELEFKKYIYDKYYQPHTDSYLKIIIAKCYYIYLCINDSEFYINNKVSDLIRNHFIELSIYNIINGQKYKCYNKIDEVSYFINYRNNNLGIINPWYTQINNNSQISYNFKISKFTTINDNYCFGNYGGIIENNNYWELMEIFSRYENALVIKPNYLKSISKNQKNISYQNLINEKYLCRENYDIIIIQELDMSKILSIKKIIKKFNPRFTSRKIWIINSLPLVNYLKTHEKIILDEFEYYLSFVIDMDNYERSKIKYSLMNHLLSNINNYYIKYQSRFNTFGKKYTTIKISELESDIKKHFWNYFDKWKNNLKTKDFNTYSNINKKKMRLVHYNICDTIIRFILSNSNKLDNEMFNEIIDTELNILGCIKKFIVEKYENEIDNKKKDELSANIIEIKNHKKNLQRYSKNKYSEILSDSECPICYCDESSDMGIFVCGHKYCIECTINTLATNTLCPMCKARITVDKTRYYSKNLDYDDPTLVKYINNQVSGSIIITDYRITKKLKKISNNNIHIFNIDNIKFKKIDIIASLINIPSVIFICSKIAQSKVKSLSNYFSNFNTPPDIQFIRTGLENY